MPETNGFQIMKYRQEVLVKNSGWPPTLKQNCYRGKNRSLHLLQAVLLLLQYVSSFRSGHMHPWTSSSMSIVLHGKMLLR